MKLIYGAVGKTRDAFLREGISEYTRRISRYLPFEMVELPEARLAGKSSQEQHLLQESQGILTLVAGKDSLVLLDKGGKELSSEELAGFLRQKMNEGTRYLVFVSGGAYGFHSSVHNLPCQKISLSRMTFPHQLVRLIILEQLYRAFTIIQGEPYHHA